MNNFVISSYDQAIAQILPFDNINKKWEMEGNLQSIFLLVYRTRTSGRENIKFCLILLIVTFYLQLNH